MAREGDRVDQQPKIKPRVSDEKRSILRVRTWELLGFGCYHAWFLSIILGGCFFAPENSEEWVRLVRLGFSFGLAGGYILLFILRHKSIVAHITKEKVVIGGVMASLGTAIVAIPLSGVAGYSIAIIASGLTGLGNAFLMTAGGEFWAANRPERAMIQLSTSVVAAIAAFYLLSVLPSVVRIPLICLLPLACALILVLSKGGKHRTTSNLSKDFFGSNLEIRFIVSIFGIAASCGIILGTAIFLAPIEMIETTRALLVAPFFVSIGVLIVALRTISSRFLAILAQLSSVCLVIGCILALAFYIDSSLVGVVFIMVGYLLFDQFLWLLHSELIHRSQAAAVEVLPRFEMVQSLGVSIGFFISQVAMFPYSNLAESNWLIYLVCGIVFAVIFLVLFKNSDISRIVEVRFRVGSQLTLEEQCRTIANRFSLSSREYEVLVLLARGRSSPYIQDELCIAQGTVKAHIRHIYDKMGVSNKQELINLIEGSNNA